MDPVKLKLLAFASDRFQLPAGGVICHQGEPGDAAWFVIEGLLIAGLPSWVKRAMENVIRTPDHIMRVTGLVSAVGGLLLIWAIRH